MRRIRTIVVAAAVAAALIGAAPAAASTAPTKGVWLTCSTAAYCQQWQDLLTYVGVKRVMQTVTGSCAEAQAIGNRWSFYNAGIRVNWVAYNGNAVLVDCTKNLASTIGYYIWDEPYPTASSTVEAWQNAVVAHAPWTTTLISHFGCSSGAWHTAASPYFNNSHGVGATCYPITNADNTATDAGVVYGPFHRLYTDGFGGPKFGVVKAFSWADSRYNECGNPAVCLADKFPSWPEFRASYDCAAYANLNEVYAWGFDDWKDWHNSGDSATRAKFDGRWSALVNGFYVNKAIATSPCNG